MSTVSDARVDVLVIGAGPSGLCLADALSRSTALSIAVVERDAIGSTWMHSPPELRVLSPWWTNILSFRDLFRHSPFALVRARAYLEHLQEFAQRRAIRVTTGVTITSVVQGDGAWIATAEDGRTWHAPYVVCATGYFSAPAMPEPAFESDGSVPTIHAAEIGDYDRYARVFAGKHVLVVGKRVTAGQLLVEFASRGVSVTLSATAPIQFHRSGAWGYAVDQTYFLYEAARIRLQPGLTSNSYPPMEGGRARRLLESGVVARVDRLAQIRDGAVVLEDGSRLHTDYVVLATGYRPALDYLSRLDLTKGRDGLPRLCGFELADAPGIFVLGFDNLRNFRSRYLRGIRSDAKLLAKDIAARVGGRHQEKASTS